MDLKELSFTDLIELKKELLWQCEINPYGDKTEKMKKRTLVVIAEIHRRIELIPIT